MNGTQRSGQSLYWAKGSSGIGQNKSIYEELNSCGLSVLKVIGVTGSSIKHAGQSMKTGDEVQDLFFTIDYNPGSYGRNVIERV